MHWVQQNSPKERLGRTACPNPLFPAHTHGDTRSLWQRSHLRPLTNRRRRNGEGVVLFIHRAVMVFLFFVVVILVVWLSPKSYILASLSSMMIEFRSIVLVSLSSGLAADFFRVDEKTCSYRRHDTALLVALHIFSMDWRSRNENISDSRSVCSSKKTVVNRFTSPLALLRAR